MESSFTFLRVRGIPIGANWSWLLVFALIAWSLASALFPRTYPGESTATYAAMGIVTAVLFFASILLHELGHAFRALKEGMRIEGITLWLFGGVAKFTGMFPSPGAEFRIAIAGPVVSVALAAGFAALTWLGNLVGGPEVVVGVLDYLARINAIVVAFNLVPALPLDGGRVLRSWLWHRQRSFTAATISAARAGRAFGWLLIGIGVLGLFTGAGIGGLWFAVLGWFLLQAAQAEASFALFHQTFRGARVRDLMTTHPETVSPETTLTHFFDEVSRTKGHSTYPVVDHSGQLVGLVSLRLAASIAVPDRATTTVADVMLPRPDVPVVDPDTTVLEAMELLRARPGRAVVLEETRVAGIVSVSDVAKALEIEQARGLEEEPGARRAGALVWVVVAVMMAVAAAALYHPPLAVIRPGIAVNVADDITISGVPTQPVNGEILLTSVRLEQPSALMAAVAYVRSEDVLPLSQIIPSGTNPSEYFEEQRSVFQESRLLAAGAAARAAGMDVTLTGNGATVVTVVEGSPAAAALERGDVIVAVDGRPISLANEVGETIQARPPGTTFSLTVERDGQQRTAEVRSARLGRQAAPDDAARIGVVLETRDFDVQLPFEVRFKSRDVGGPSAGLAYALAIADMIDPADIAEGRRIATTGTIDLEGRVGPVGGVREKAEAAEDEDARVFLVPTGEVDQAHGIRGLDVRGVATLGDAIKALTA